MRGFVLRNRGLGEQPEQPHQSAPVFPVKEPQKYNFDTVLPPSVEHRKFRVSAVHDPRFIRTLKYGSIGATICVVFFSSVILLAPFFAPKPTLSATRQNTQFMASESPSFSLDTAGLVDVQKIKQDIGTLSSGDGSITASVTRGGKNVDSIHPEITSDGSGTNKFTVQLRSTQTIKPGKYTLSVVLKKAPSLLSKAIEQNITQDFTWGVLALNPDKAVYARGEDAFLSMAVLDDKGFMVCDANVTLQIVDPVGEINTLSTDNGGVKTSSYCHVYDNENPVPDHYASYKTNLEGKYTLKLHAETKDGARDIEDSFSVDDKVPFEITRNAPTRIYPANIAKVEMTIKANEDFLGTIQETVPGSFVIQEGDYLVEKGVDTQTISWNKHLSAGDTIALDYRYLAPLVSPEFYLTGPLGFSISKNNLEPKVIYQEPRQWMIASDATAAYTTGSGNWASPITGTVTLELHGGGGGGGRGGTSNKYGGGGGAGGQAVVNSTVSVTKGTNYAYALGGSGAGGTTGNGSAGGDSTLSIGGTTYIAKGGTFGYSYANGRAGGAGSTTGGVAGSGGTVYAGGSGAAGTTLLSGGGGGGAGSAGTGKNATTSTGGVATVNNGGKGGNGSTANAAAGSPGSVYGGAGGGGTKASVGGAGAGGYVLVTFADNTPPTVALSSPADAGTVTSFTPQLDFVGTDATYADDIRYEVQVDGVSNAFGNLVLDKISGTDAGFSDVTNSGDTDPFASGDTVRYTVQSELNPGTTYYWRVRGTDPSGTNTYGAWGSIRSFTTPDGITVSTTGTQVASMAIPSTANYVGGAFTMVRSSSTANVTSIKISENGTVNANANLSNAKLYYETAATCTYDGNETQYGSTASFDSSDDVTFAGSTAVGTSQICFYLVYDVGSGATAGQTNEIEITNPSTDVVVSAGITTPSTAVAVAGTTTLVGLLTVSTTGTQTANMDIPSTNNYLGGAFAMSTNSGTANVSSIKISEKGTVAANTNLANAKLYYETTGTCSYDGNETQFGTTQSFDSSQTATFTGGFGTDGTVTYNSGGTQYDRASAITIDSSNNTYVAGYQDTNGFDWAIQKYSSAGVLDTNFGTSGMVTYNSGGTQYDTANAITIDSSNNIYVAGEQSTNGYDWAIRKYSSAGVLDTNFGTSGTVTYNSGGVQYDYARAITIDSSSNIYVAGSIGTNGADWAIRKYSSAGVLDTNFGTSGMVTYNSGGTQYDNANAITIDSNSNIYVAGYQSTNGNDWLIRKYSPAGVLDTNFGTSGMVTYNSGGTQEDLANAITIDSSNNIYVAGYQGTNGADWAIRKYSSAGVLDTNFGTGGMVTYDSGGTQYDNANAITIDSSNNIYVAGYQGTNGNDWAIQKYSSAGVLDTNFGTGGMVTYGSGGTQEDRANAITIDSSSNIYVAGYQVSGSNGNDWAVQKYTSDGSPGSGGISVGTSQICLYVVFDVGSGASGGDTVEIEITNPSTDIAQTGAVITQSSVVAVAGTTTIGTPPGPITISGSVYTNEAKTTNIGAGKTVHLFVDSTDGGTYDTTSGGVFTFSALVAANNTVIVYLDGETEKGSTVTLPLNGTTNITSLDIITGHVSLEHRGTGPITNTNLDAIDSVDVGNQDGITIASGNATFADGYTLYILNGKTYTPGGTVTVDSFGTVGTAVFSPAANAVTVSGNWAFSATGTLTTSGTVTFDGSTTQIITGTNAWYNLTINNSAGVPNDTYDVDPTAAQTVAGTLTVTDGQYTPYTGDTYANVAIGMNGVMKPDASASISVSGNWSNAVGTFTHNSGTVNLTGAGATTQVISGNTTFNNLSATASAARTINFASGTTQTMAGTWTCTGSAGQNISLGRDGGSGSNQWNINPTAWSVNYVAPANSNNQASTSILPVVYTDGGNNTNWFPALTVSTSGTQTSNMDIPSTNNYLGGAFTMSTNAATANVSSIKISEKGTVNANTNLANAKLYYETTGTCSYDGNETQFGTTQSFDSSQTATFTGGFGTDGTATYNSGGVQADYAYAITKDSSGNIYVAGGQEDTYGSDWAIRKYSSAGVLDTNFGTGGTVTYNSGGTQYDVANAITIDSSNNIYVAGDQETNGYDWAIRKYSSAGVLDTNFGTGGLVTYNSGGAQYDYANAITIDSSNNIYVAGDQETNGNDWAIRKYSSAGVLDTNFGTGGLVAYDSAGAQYDFANAITIDSSSNIYVAGIQGTNGGDWAIRKYSSAGVLDTNFGTGGLVTYDSGYNALDSANAITIDSSSNIYVAGNQGTNAGDRAIQKYSSAGVLDTNFGTGGTVTYNSGGVQTDSANAITIDTNRNIYVVGGQSTNGDDWLIQKYDTNGDVTSGVSVGTSQVCFYVVFDVGSGASGGDTAEIEITNPSTDIALTGVVVTQSSAVAIAGTTTLIVPTLTASTSGSQIPSMSIPSTNNYLGGDFTMSTNSGTANVSSIKISEKGTVNANTNLSNAKLYYETAGTCSYDGNETQFGTTQSFDSSQTTTFAGGFGTDGMVTYDSGGAQDETADAITTDSSGNIYVAGYQQTNGIDWAIQKYSSAGVLDTNFGTGGLVTYNSGGVQADYATAITIDSSNNIYVAGYIGTNGKDWAIRKYSSAGVLDTNFGTGGMVTYNSGGVQSDIVNAITIDSSSNIYVAGSQGTNGNDWVIQKYSSGGVLDTNFGTGGTVIYNSGGVQYDYARAITIDSSSNIYVAGDIGINGKDWAIRKYSSDGVLDTNFGTGGMVTYNSGGVQYDYAYAITIDSSSNIYVAGYQPTNGNDWVIQKYSSAGVLDTNFGTGGTVTYNSGGAQVDDVYAITIDSSDNIYVAGFQGTNGTDWAIRKYSSAGVLDTNFGTGGTVTYNSGATQDIAYAITIDSSDNIYVAGYQLINGADWAVRKYDMNGNLASGISVGTSQICFYVVFDVGSGATGGDTVEVEITNPSTDIDLSGAVVTQSSVVAVAGTTTLIVPTLTASTFGSQISSMSVPSTNNYLGGDFTMSTNTGTASVSSIKISEKGTVNANTNLSNAKLYYETAGTCSYDGNETQFGSTQSFDNFQTATFAEEFGTDGTVTYDSGGALSDSAVAITKDSSDNIYVAGYIGTNGKDWAIRKYSSAGVLDTNFGTGGLVTYNSGGTQSDTANAITIDSSNNIYVAGYQGTNNYDWAIQKYSSAGVLDTNFGTGGLVTYNSGGAGYDRAQAITIDSSDNIYVAGYIGTNGDDWAIQKYSSAGVLDTNFGTGGTVTYNSGGTNSDIAYAITIDSSSNIYVAGYQQTNGIDWAIQKYSSAGVLDTNFGTGGTVTYDSGGALSDDAYAITIDSSDNIYVAGYIGTNGRDWAIRKYSSAGVLDTNFGTGGLVTYNSGGAQIDIAYAITIDSSSNIYVAGSQGTNGRDWAIQKYSSAGVLDTNFGTGGLVTYNSGGAQIDIAYAITIDSSSNIYVAGSQGTNGNDWAIQKYYTNGNLFSGISIGTSQVCFYVVFDVGSGASAGDTVEIEITNPSTDIVLSGVVITQSSVVAVAGTTTLSSGSSNTPPNGPTTLTQGTSSGTNNISESAWTKSNIPYLGFTVSDSDGVDTVKYQLQLANNSSFTTPIIDFTPTSTSSNPTTFAFHVGTYTGGTCMGSCPSTLGDLASGYWWRVKGIDNSAAESAWVEAGVAGTMDFKLDATAPTGGTIKDGTDATDDQYNTGSLSALSAYWTTSEPTFTVSGKPATNVYQYAVGTTSGASDTKTWTYTGTSGTETFVNATGLTLHTSQIYFFSVRAYDAAGNYATISSDGQMVLPTFSVSFTNSGGGNIADLGIWQDPTYGGNATTQITTTTNANSGYLVYMYMNTPHLQKASDASKYVLDITGAAYPSAQPWATKCPAGTACFGYTSNDASITTSARGNMYSSGSNYCALSTVGAGNVVADEVSAQTSGQSFTITYKAQTNAMQSAGAYTTGVQYTVVPQY